MAEFPTQWNPLKNAWLLIEAPGEYVLISAKPGLSIQVTNWVAQKHGMGSVAATIQWKAGAVFVTPGWKLTDGRPMILPAPGNFGALFEGLQGEPIAIVVSGGSEAFPVAVKVNFYLSGQQEQTMAKDKVNHAADEVASDPNQTHLGDQQDAGVLREGHKRVLSEDEQFQQMIERNRTVFGGRKGRPGLLEEQGGK